MITEADNERLQKSTEELVVALTLLSIAATELIYLRVNAEKQSLKPAAPPIEKT